jgi:hypothetical protein
MARKMYREAIETFGEGPASNCGPAQQDRDRYHQP